MDLEQAYEKIYRYLYFKLRDKHLAEDLTQESFLRYINQNRSVSHPEMKYLYTIARNLCIDEYRRITPSRLPEEDAESMIPDGTNMEEHILLRDALERLTPEDREMLLLRYANDERIGTISALLNQSRFSTYRRLKSAEKHLRDAWEVSDK